MIKISENVFLKLIFNRLKNEALHPMIAFWAKKIRKNYTQIFNPAHIVQLLLHNNKRI